MQKQERRKMVIRCAQSQRPVTKKSHLHSSHARCSAHRIPCRSWWRSIRTRCRFRAPIESRLKTKPEEAPARPPTPHRSRHTGSNERKTIPADAEAEVRRAAAAASSARRIRAVRRTPVRPAAVWVWCSAAAMTISRSSPPPSRSPSSSSPLAHAIFIDVAPNSTEPAEQRGKDR